jgi:DedD protein
MAESEAALQLKRRARRRLVGAIALVSFVVIILPLILDKEPGPAGPPLDVQIPKQESGGFTNRAVPPAAQMPAAPAPEKKAEIPPARADPLPVTAQPALAEKTAVAPALPADKGDEGRAQAEAWVVTLDAFANPKNVAQLRTKLTAAGVKSYTEAVKTSKGDLTRVRAGPFASKEAAETARAKLESLGLKPGAVTSR